MGTPLCHCGWRRSGPSFLIVGLENGNEQLAMSGVGENPPSPPALRPGHRGTAVKERSRVAAPPPP